ncbi:acyl-CoA thioesterase [Streptococcus saliviloxodontae]|uniref:Acyl-CoA thioester hydrolase n=1 Tax=Streptococcus saliviloxodontae TaxID=1349416 RepID=A0ABS2PIP6_9STRE|nr:acyl-CoA thioesterase [Streptococcus saliviloxodontae]MBM7635310.1 acyl-CoA thioester hydrolase [Streptococcus saliviloxodontae]
MTITYKHYVQYYETDRMGISHHSNYIRWMEEARTHLLKEIGWPYDKIEEAGIISPVTRVSCDYKATTTFADEVTIVISVSLVKAARLGFDYKMTNQDGQEVCSAHSEHSFLNSSGQFVNLKKEVPDFFQQLTELVDEKA